MNRRTIARIGVALVLAASAPAAALAHGPQDQSTHPMMGQGSMTGQGSMMGPGMMMGGGMMGPGMMGFGSGNMMGAGMMGYGMSSRDRNFSPDDITAILRGQLAWAGYKHLKVGKVAAKDDDTILAEIVTKEGSLVEKLSVDRHTGRMVRTE